MDATLLKITCLTTIYITFNFKADSYCVKDYTCIQISMPIPKPVPMPIPKCRCWDFYKWPVLICLKTETSIPAQMIFYLAMTLPIVKESIENAKNLK